MLDTSLRPIPSEPGAFHPRSTSAAGHRKLGRIAWLALAASLMALPLSALPFSIPGTDDTQPTPTIELRHGGGPAQGNGALGGPADALLQIDDGTAEGVFGFTGPGTRPFLFFNRFESPGAFYLDSIQVLFPDGTEISPGDAIELVVYAVARGASAANAELLLALDEQVQTTDGVTFSTYPLAEPLELLGGDDLLVGVINRYYMSGTLPEETRPAAIDTTAPGGRSFFALWAGDAADSPDLGAAVEISPIDGLIAANFMIRADGRPAPVVDVPTLDHLGTLLLLGLLLAAGLKRLPR